MKKSFVSLVIVAFIGSLMLMACAGDKGPAELAVKAAEEAVNAVFDALTAALKKGEEVRLPAFGVFAVSQTAARKARNPQTGEEVIVPAGKRARFRPGKALKESLN